MAHGYWTDERSALVERLWAEGYSASEIAARLPDVTRNAVIGKVHRLGISRRQKGHVRGVRVQSAVSIRTRKENTGLNGLTLQRAKKAREIAAARAPVIEPIKPVDPPKGGITIMQLKDHHCRWPLGEPAFDMKYCGATVVLAPYCPEHAKRAFQYHQQQHDFSVGRA